MKKLAVLGLAILILITQISSAFAIANRRAIQWEARPEAFVRSLYIGVLGRQPENDQVVIAWARNVNRNSRSRLNVFWGFVGSPEYKNNTRPWAGLSKEWLVIRTRERKVVEPSRMRTEPCNCYYVTKSPRHRQKVLSYSKATYPVAMAVLNYYAIFDIDTCPGDCGASRASATQLPPPTARAPANQLPPPTAITIPPTSACRCEDRFGGGIEYFLVRDGRLIKRKLGWSECENLKKSHSQCR